MATSTMAMQNIWRSTLTLRRLSRRAPVRAPNNTPIMTGQAMPGAITPRCTYMTAEAQAVTPIIKLLVVVLTLKGTFIMASMASTLSTPEPMPSMPDSTPATYITPKPPPTWRNW